MSTTVRIKPKGVFSKKIGLEDLLSDRLGFGVYDDSRRLDEGKQGAYTEIFEREAIGRGIEVHFDDKEVELYLSLPSTTRDIGLFYMMVSHVCGLMGTTTFYREGERADLSMINGFYEMDLETSRGALEHTAEEVAKDESRSLIIMGVRNPISIGKREVEEIGGDTDKFGELLHRLQAMDVYYASPGFYQAERGDGETYIFGSYAISAGIPSVVPNEARKPFYASRELEVKAWYVLLGYTDESRNQVLRVVGYEDFIGYVQNKEYYDAEHVIVSLTDEDVDEMLRLYQTRIS